MNAVKRIVFNQIVNDKSQTDHVSAFMDIAIRNQRRKFRIIIEEVEPIVDTNADTAEFIALS